MNRNHLVAAAMAALALAWSVPSDAQAPRGRSPTPQLNRPVDRYPAQRSRSPDLYAVEPGRNGTITATTPNQWGNLGGPSTGGGGGSP